MQDALQRTTPATRNSCCETAGDVHTASTVSSAMATRAMGDDAARSASGQASVKPGDVHVIDRASKPVSR